MNRLQQLARKSWTFSSIGSTFTEPPFWSRDPLTYASPLLGDREAIETNFEGYCAGAYKRNGIVFACILARLMVMSEARFLTIAEVAAKMRVSKMTVYRLVHGGELPAVRVGRSFRVTEDDVNEYLRKSFYSAG